MKRLALAAVGLLLIGTACTSKFANDSPDQRSPSPSPTLAAGDGGWPVIVSHPLQSDEGPITGHVAHANGTPASHYCVILSSGPCAVTTDGNGSFTTSFAKLFLGPIDIVVKGPYNAATGDGPVQAIQRATMTAQGIQTGTIFIP